MPEQPTAAHALTAFAGELDRLETEVEGGDFGTGLALAAQLARQRAEKFAARTEGPQTATGEGPAAGELTGDLSAAAPIVITRDELLSEWRKAHPGECSCPPDRPDRSCPQHGGDLSASERDAVMADLGKLLEVLGLGDCARPQSPHEVMLECIAGVAKIRAAERARILAGAGYLVGHKPSRPENLCMVPWDKLAALIQDVKP